MIIRSKRVARRAIINNYWAKVCLKRRFVTTTGATILLGITFCSVLLLLFAHSEEEDPIPEGIVENFLDYMEWSNRNACQTIHGYGGIMKPWGMTDQKSVCFDLKVKPKQDRCLVYSFGLQERSEETILESQFALYGCQVHAFYPKVHDSLNQTDSSNRIHWYNWGLGDRDHVGGEGAWQVKTLDSIYKSLSKVHGNRIIDYVKLDIEYGEWAVLEYLISSGTMLDRILQLSIEFHLPSLSESYEFRRWAELLRTLERKYGLVRFDSKPGSGCIRWIESLQRTTFCTYDLAWYNKRLQRSVTTQRPLDW